MEICQCGGRMKPCVSNGIKGSECTSCGGRVWNNQLELEIARGENVPSPEVPHCRHCKGQSFLVEILPDDHHQGVKLSCADCGRWTKWCSYAQMAALWDKKLA